MTNILQNNAKKSMCRLYKIRCIYKLASYPCHIRVLTVDIVAIRTTMMSFWNLPILSSIPKTNTNSKYNHKLNKLRQNFTELLYPPNNEVVGGYIGFTPSVRLSVRLSACPSVRLSRLPCPLCNIYSSGWILSILATNDHYHERVCRT